MMKCYFWIVASDEIRTRERLQSWQVQ